MTTRRYDQVDVFTVEPYRGNPVAVVLDGQGLTNEEMERFTRWTNLSEATFVLPPTEPDADYRGVLLLPPGAPNTPPPRQPQEWIQATRAW